MDTGITLRFLALKKQVLKKQFSRMNDRQAEAVFHTNGPLLILAGAGSGKTTVIVNRIANLVRYGLGYYSAYIPEDLKEADLKLLEQYSADSQPLDLEGDPRLKELLCYHPVQPWNILAITFTNKAGRGAKGTVDRDVGRAGSRGSGFYLPLCVCAYFEKRY